MGCDRCTFYFAWLLFFPQCFSPTTSSPHPSLASGHSFSLFIHKPILETERWPRKLLNGTTSLCTSKPMKTPYHGHIQFPLVHTSQNIHVRFPLQIHCPVAGGNRLHRDQNLARAAHPTTEGGTGKFFCEGQGSTQELHTMPSSLEAASMSVAMSYHIILSDSRLMGCNHVLLGFSKAPSIGICQ